MGKFRSKLKRSGKGKNWKSGQSSTCNPENKKHRNMAKSRFFQTNLSLGKKILYLLFSYIIIYYIENHFNFFNL